MRNPEGYETRQGFSSLIYSSWGQNTFKYTQLLHLSVPTALQREGRGGGGETSLCREEGISNTIIACKCH